jgi:hypothetical protein
LSADHSCRAAVARLIAHRISRGQSPCSGETGAYCQARKRLPEKFFSAVACLVGRTWTPSPSTAGCGKGDAFTCSTVRRSRCQTPERTRQPTRRSTTRSRGSDFRSRASER